MTHQSHFKPINFCMAVLISIGCIFANGTPAPVFAAARGLSASYLQNFDGLAASGNATWTNDSSLPGWYASRGAYSTDTGSSGAGGMYSYGSAASSERAFGAIPKKNSGGTIYKGLLLRNDTAQTITRLYIAYTGEQWRNSAGGAQTLVFSYQESPSAITNLTAGTWTNLPALNFTARVTGGTASALNGNLPANQRRLSGTLAVTLPANGYIMLRWMDADDQGADHGLAMDDLVVSANLPPQALADAYFTSEDTPLSVTAPEGVLANDIEPETSPLTAVLASSTAHGTLALNADGSFTFTPTSNWNGTDSFTYTASDGNLSSPPATVTITVGPVNDASVAGFDSGETAEDVPLSVAAPGVLVNDSDVDGDPLSASVVLTPVHGTLILNTDGGYTYTPEADWHGSDYFTYTASDGAALSNTATVTLTVTPVQDAPQAAADDFDGAEDTVLSVPAPGVLANDTDPDGDALHAVWVSNPSHGSLTLNLDGGFAYQPDANWNGEDHFTYQASNGGRSSAIETVTLRVQPANDPPVASFDSAETNEDTPLTVAAPGVLANDSDVDLDTLRAVLVLEPQHGTLVLNQDGSYVYTPAANWNGNDSFNYTAFDGTASSNTATVTLTVHPINDAPMAVADAYSLDEDSPLTITTGGVLENDTDVEGDALTAVLDSGPLHGDLTLNADGSFSYTPGANWNGSDGFSYHASDGQAASGIVAVALTVDPVNDAPHLVSALPDQNHVARMPFSFAASAHFADIDEGDVLSFSAQLADGNPLPAWLSIDAASGVLSSTPDKSAAGAYTLRISASDGLETIFDDFVLTVATNQFLLFIPMVQR